MPIIIRRRSVPKTAANDVEAFVGGPVGVDVIPLGTKVRVVSPGASRFVCRSGDIGEVVKHCRAGGFRDERPSQDLYFVKLEAPRGDKGVVYLTYSEIVRV